MRMQTHLLGDLAERLDLPGEALGKLRICAVGRGRVLIEGHRGLLICTRELIALRGERGRVAIKGRELQIEAMDGDAMLIRGEVDRIEWED